MNPIGIHEVHDKMKIDKKSLVVWAQGNNESLYYKLIDTFLGKIDQEEDRVLIQMIHNDIPEKEKEEFWTLNHDLFYNVIRSVWRFSSDQEPFFFVSDASDWCRGLIEC